jgi:hypothetical protein
VRIALNPYSQLLVLWQHVIINYSRCMSRKLAGVEIGKGITAVGTDHSPQVYLVDTFKVANEENTWLRSSPGLELSTWKGIGLLNGFYLLFCQLFLLVKLFLYNRYEDFLVTLKGFGWQISNRMNN